MGDNIVAGVVTIATAIIGVAIIAVLVSRNANTTGVLQSGGQAFGSVLAVAESPVTGSSGNSTGFGNMGFTGFGSGYQID
jgi:hypothetical protein